MRRGYVHSVTEQGIDSDAELPRLTFRYRARSWCVVVDPEGTLVNGRRPPTSAPAERRLQRCSCCAPSRRIRTGHMTPSAGIGTSWRLKSLDFISGRILRVEPYLDCDRRANVERSQAPRKFFERGALW